MQVWHVLPPSPDAPLADPGYKLSRPILGRLALNKVKTNLWPERTKAKIMKYITALLILFFILYFGCLHASTRQVPILKPVESDCAIGFILTSPMHGYDLNIQSVSKDGFGRSYKLFIGHGDELPKGASVFFNLKGLHLSSGRYFVYFSKFGISYYSQFESYKQGKATVIDLYDFEPNDNPNDPRSKYTKKIATCRF
ncbi:hypothetical protein PQU95_05735 [Vogesella sp. DC21W]|uniref:Uncharacterized protein n=1 Tax=Vogesella aquatica TaxID=2984206 RepID=A0ABT5IVX6_9NEIS|nr:hypothetical protein [Vogesella aquatica]MDC7716715.1 hypothetical protein [Vogesella aquatica]